MSTTIQWTDETWNPTTGCTRVSEGCRNCYIERTPAFRMAGRKFVNGTTGVDLHPDRLDRPLHWKKPRRVFVNSLSDLFHEDIPDSFIDKVFGVMGSEEAGHHTFQVLTKRPQRMLAYTERFTRSGIKFDGLFPQVWLGVSVEDQATADQRIPILLQASAAVRFISAEPLLDAINFNPWWLTRAVIDLAALTYGGQVRKPNPNPSLDWVIIGGESGPGARTCDVDWIRSIKDQCQAARVPVFVKQLGSCVIDRNDAGFEGDTDTSWPMDTRIEEHPFGYESIYQGAPVRIRLNDKKGGDMAEWPSDLRVRQFPC